MFDTKMQPGTRATARVRLIGAVILIGCSVAFVACSTNTPTYRESYAEGSLVIAVRHWQTDKMDSNYSGSSDFGQILAENIAGSLQDLGYRAMAISRGAPLPAGTIYEFDGSFENLYSGSWNLRFWIGFGAGHALVNASGTLTEVATGEVILSEMLRARSNTWQFQENILRRSCSRIARGFAKKTAKALRD